MSLRVALISLHTSPNDEPGRGDVGGMNVAVHHTALSLARLGHEVEVITRRTDPDAPAAVQIADRVLLRRLTTGPAEPRDKADHEQFIDAFSARLAELGPYDVLHAHHWFSGIAALPIAEERSVPLVQSFHSIAAAPDSPLADGERPESPGRLAGEARLALAADAVVTVSDAERDTVVHRLGARPDRVTTVRPGVDTRMFRPLRGAEREPGGGGAAHPPALSAAVGGMPPQGYLLLAARLEPLKGVDLAIRALARLPRAARPVLVVSGGATSGYEEHPAALRSLAAAEGVGDEVRFIGPQGRPELAALLRGARALVVPSHSETFGLIALEAQASGTPVVAARAGGLREAVADGSTGILVDGRDPDRWAAVLRMLLDDDALATRLGRAGRARAVPFGWDRTARGTAAVYERLLAAPGAGEPRRAGSRP